MKSRKRDNSRKSRRLRLPSSSFSGPRARINVRRDLQRRLAQALGVPPFTASDVKSLRRIVNQYFAVQPFERSAPHVEDAKRYISEMQIHAHAFLKALVPKAAHAKAATYVQRIIMDRYRRHKDRATDWNDLATPIHNLLRESDYALGILQNREHGGFREGDAFKGLLRNLTQLCDDRAWPTAASKGHVKKRQYFVAFVQVLQKAFPEEFRRHDYSDAALAKAISDARRKPSGTLRRETRSS